jgi:VanZ family protein
MLGILVVNALTASGVKGFKGIVIAFLICVLYAVSDEVHQLYVPGRGCQITDVLIDSGGALAGISLFTVLRRIFIRWRHRDMSVGCKI